MFLRFNAYALVEGFVKMNYVFIKTKKMTQDTILFIHGWGSNLKTMLPLQCLEDKYHLLFIDLPGCGETQEPEQPLQYDDYVNQIVTLTEKMKLNICYLVGHSFGGKLAIGLCKKYSNLLGLFLISPSIIRPKHGFQYYSKVYIYKALKKFRLLKYFSKHSFGSQDYQNATPVMKQTLIQILQVHLEEELKNITLPVLLLWANQDEQTPFYMAKKAKQLLVNSEIVSINGDHFAYFHQANYTTRILEAFVKGVDKNANR